MTEPDDLDQLREQFPEWRFGSVWSSANSGPDRRQVWARCGDVTLSAWSEAELGRKIEAAGR